LNNETLPVSNGAPIRVRIERALGYKQPKYVHTIELVDSFVKFGQGQGGYWEDHGYDWYGGIWTDANPGVNLLFTLLAPFGAPLISSTKLSRRGGIMPASLKNLAAAAALVAALAVPAAVL